MDRAHPDSVVLVIDLQTGMFDGLVVPRIADVDALAEHAISLIGWARKTGRKVAFIRHGGDMGHPLEPGTQGWPVWPELGQAANEPTFDKTVGNAFSNPALAPWVTQHGGTEVVLLGAQTDRCVAETVNGALELGLNVVVAGDAHSTWDRDGETAQNIVARHNADFVRSGAKVVPTAQLILT